LKTTCHHNSTNSRIFMLKTGNIIRNNIFVRAVHLESSKSAAYKLR
jgi:hypothetical protein